MAKLTFVLEDGQEVVVPLTEHLTIGRGENNDVVVDDERIGLQHAELLQNADGSIQVFDLKSESGTFVNGERQLSCTLLHGDRLAFGPLVALLDLELPAAATPSAAAPKKSPPAAPKPADDHAEAIAHLEAEKARLKAEVEGVEKELRDWEQRAEKERAMHNARVESLRAEEKQLAPLQAAVQEAKSAHHDWLESIATLTAQHEEKTTALERLNTQHFEKSTEVQRLTTAATAAQEKVDALTDRLKQVRDECEQDEVLLNTLRQQVIEMETRLKEGQELATARCDQVHTAEKKIEQLEQLAQHLEKVEGHIEELRGSEERLEQAQARCQEAETRHATLTAAIEALSQDKQSAETAVKDLTDRSTTLQQSATAAAAALARVQADLAAETRSLEAAQARRAEIEQQCQELATTQQQSAETAVKDLTDRSTTLQQSATAAAAALARVQDDLAAETRSLEATQARRAEIEQQCQELATTQQQLADARQRLTAVEQRYRDVQANQTEGGSQIAKRKGEDQPAAAGDSAQYAELTRQIEAARLELAELEARTATLRANATATQALGNDVAPEPANTHAFALRIVHVDAIRHSPIPMKSERTRVQSADGSPAAPKTSAAKAKAKKS